MFQRLPDLSVTRIAYRLNGELREGVATDTVAAAIVAEVGGFTKRSAIGAHPRAPYCMMGVCFECLVTIDGIGNRQACLVQLAEGMQIQTGAASRDVFE